MGSIIPIATQAIGLAKTVGTVATVLNQTTNLVNSRNDRGAEQAIRQLRDQQKLEESRAAQRANTERQEIGLRAEEAEQARRSALKRAVARQRARFGGAGISSNNGSSEAVLLGLFDESDEERSNRDRLDRLRLQSIDNNLANVKRVNTLQRTQAESRNSLARNLRTRSAAQGFIDSIF